MFAHLLKSESFRRAVADHPRGASEFSAVRVLLKKIIWAFQSELQKTGIRIDWDSEHEETRDPEHLVIYDMENDGTRIIPVVLSKVLVCVGARTVFVGHDRGPVLLGRAIIDEIEKSVDA